MNENKVTFESMPLAVSEILNKLDKIEMIINSRSVQQPVSSDPEPYIYGIKGLAKFLNISTVTAQRVKNSGRIPFSQMQRTIIFKKDDVLKSLSNSYNVK
ncbi:MAG: DUF3853 family protein [Bacteroidetes bacterium]|nr:DUF3853 family protein [Bacteroidota bacterium]